MHQENSLSKKIVLGGSILLGLAAILMWLKSTSKRRIKKVHRHNGSCRSQLSVALSLSQSGQKLAYENPIRNQHAYELPVYTSKQYKFQRLSYRIFLKITKGLGYFGTVGIDFKLPGWIRKDLKLEFNGTEVLYLSINGKMVPQDQVQFQHHRLTLPSQYLAKHTNSVIIFFFNKYSFFDDGMSTYFNIDDQNRYSLKQQCIYTKSNKYTLPRIIPCFNQPAECFVEVSLIHQDNCLAFSSGDKRSIKTFYESDYPNYKCMFNEDRLTSSSRISSRSFKNQTRNITHFANTRLNSIQELFLSSLPFVQVRTSSNMLPTIRFYCRRSISNVVAGFTGFLLHQIERILLGLTNHSQFIPAEKIDFLFIDSNSMNGYFSKGVVVLNQKLIKKPLNIKTLYLVLRAFLAKFAPPASFNETIELNRRVARIFQPCVSYLRCQQIKFKKIFEFRSLPEYSGCYEELFSRALKYYSPGLTAGSVLQEIIAMWEGQQPKQGFWEYYLRNIQSIDIPVLQIVTQLSVRFMGKTENSQTRESLRDFFINSPLVVYFMTQKEIEDNVDKVCSLNSRKLELMVGSLSLSREQQSLLGNTLVQKYRRNSTNAEECKQLYSQFLNFDEGQNFHKMEAINEEIRRVKHVLDLEESSKQVSCSLVPAMILSRLKIKCVKDKTVLTMIELLNDVVDLE